MIERINDSKEITYQKILDAVLKLEMDKGHLTWRITDLARFSGIQRSLIYYYFGNSKAEILKSSLQLLGDSFLGLSRGAFSTNLLKSVTKVRTKILMSPHILQFYLHWRFAGGEIGEQIRRIETAYQKRIELSFPKLTFAEREAVFILMFGLISAPSLSQKSIAISLNILHQKISCN